MQEASLLRRSWVRQVGVLTVDARVKPPEMVAPGAARCGNEHGELFAGVRVRLVQLDVPPGCGTCHAAFLAWLDKLSDACTLLDQVGRTGDLARLRAVQGVLADARVDFAALSATYAGLVADLKRRIAARARTPRAGWFPRW
jgi:hypothetical protein